jgi:hypothetical protein
MPASASPTVDEIELHDVRRSVRIQPGWGNLESGGLPGEGRQMGCDGGDDRGLLREAARIRHNARMPNRRPQLQLIAPSASPEEAAAVVAALERFMRATAPVPAAAAAQLDGWRRAALIEGVSRESETELPDPWINT